MEKKMKKIDLSFLKHKQLPTKNITQQINGVDQTFSIKPISGRGLTSLALINDEDVDKASKMCLIALIYGLDLKQNQAQLFINNDLVAADSIAAQIIQYTQEYNEELTKAKAEVKKNSKEK